MPRRRTAVMVASALVLAGCASVAGVGHASGWFDPDGYDCNGRPVPSAAFEERRPVGDLDAEMRAGLTEAAARDGQEFDLSAAGGWFVLEDSAARMMVMRELDVPLDLENGEILADHEVLGLVRARTPEGVTAWQRQTSSPCPLRRELGGIGMPTVTFASAPEPASDVLRFQVLEHACTSGEGAEGRVEVVDLRESEDSVEVVLGVRPEGGGGFATCQGNPPTPFDVTLAEPLGDRVVVDGGLVAPRPVEVRTYGSGAPG